MLGVFQLRLLVIVTGLFLAPIAIAEGQSVDVENTAYWLCKNKKNVRTIRVHIGKDGICHTWYSKEGIEKSVGYGKNQESCLSILENIKTNLEKSNWSCRDITSTRISSFSSQD